MMIKIDQGVDMNYPTRQDVIDLIAKKNEEIHTQVSAKAKADGNKEPLKANWFKCTACEAGLNGSLAAAIAAAIAGFPEDTPAIAAIATATGLSVPIVTGILAGGAVTVEAVIYELCKEMKACS